MSALSLTSISQLPRLASLASGVVVWTRMVIACLGLASVPIVVGQVQAQAPTPPTTTPGANAGTKSDGVAAPARQATVEGGPLSLAEVQSFHPWGKCLPGAWKRVRVTTESLDPKGRVSSTSITETLSFLEEITERDFTLRVEVTVEVGGKRFTSQPQSIKQGYLGESAGQTATAKKIRDEEISLLGQSHSVENREVVILGDKHKRTIGLLFSPSTPPHVLRSSSVTTNGDGKTALATMQVEVLATQMPYRVLGEMHEASFVRTIHAQQKGNTTITVEVHCPDVPGGVVEHTSKELDEAGQVVKRTTLELLEFDPGNRENVEIMGRRARSQHRSRGREAPPTDRSRRR